ncbi:hypothetical protein [Rahnella sp. ChDrAdgB13]|uniref:hypothetical protein n=1 Tax=Rahnella sp. ChDrAdgB13 TaxID=1850581 RepID=UPI001AD86241|nr:hypothetical protein [Rahnella sp. ChDrAdgB13]
MKVVSNGYIIKKTEYYGVEFIIPENHNYIATDSDGAIYSFYSTPYFDGIDWHCKVGGFCRVGTAELHSSEAASSSRYYGKYPLLSPQAETSTCD